ncbi:MBL fold metallo-hydrolase [soil metagenome]
MQVRFFGVRGSIPTPGPSTVRYGGNSVCVEVRLTDGTRLLLDAGTGLREAGKALQAEGYRDKIHMLITHPHWDHIMGMPFFGPLYVKDTHIVMHPMTAKGREAFRRPPIMFDGEHFPVKFSDLPSKIERVEDVCEHHVGTATITTIELNHPGGANGFRIDDEDGTSLCYLTDNELSPPGEMITTPADLARFAAGTSLLIHDAQYLPSDMPAKHGWGHSLVSEVLALAKDAGAARVALHHHDPDRVDDELDRIGIDCARWAREHAPSLEPIVAREGLEITL